MGTTQDEKHARFQALHAGPGAFVVANPWNGGTARILTTLGFEALATTSAGLAFATGCRDAPGSLSREATLRNARDIVAATDLPVSADLQDGFGRAPEMCAETIRLAAEAGLVGGSIEDATGDPDAPVHDLELAVERVVAASEAARGLPFMLTARAESFLFGRADLDDTIRRLQAFAEVGADVLYAPGLPGIDEIRAVCAAVDKPVNVVMGLKGPVYSVAELEAAGVRRISVGGAFARAALGAFVRAAREVKECGTFDFTADAIPGGEIAAFMDGPRT